MTSDGQFNREMLVLARLQREMTQGELAEALSREDQRVSQGRISKIEHGFLEPTADLIERVARVLDYPKAFFYQRGHMYSLPVRYHRRRQSISKKTLDRIHADISIRAVQIGHLLRSATFEPDLSIPAIDVDEIGSPAKVAQAVRSLWRLPRGPITDLVGLLERAGIIVVPCDFGVPEVDAITLLTPDLPPLIFLNRSIPADRARLTLAHELGHLVMHALPNEHMEEQANRFAGEFLMPAADIRHQLSHVSLPTLAALKPLWRVSMGGILKHARVLGRVTPREYRRLWTDFGMRGYKRREPSELDISPEVPTLLRELIEFHSRTLGYGEKEMCRVLRLHPHRLRSLYADYTSSHVRLVS